MVSGFLMLLTDSKTEDEVEVDKGTKTLNSSVEYCVILENSLILGREA